MRLAIAFGRFVALTRFAEDLVIISSEEHGQ